MSITKATLSALGLNPTEAEGITELPAARGCPRCRGTGHIRSTESAALHILRILEEEKLVDPLPRERVELMALTAGIVRERRIYCNAMRRSAAA